MHRFKAFRLLAGEPRPIRRLCEMAPDELSPGDVLIDVAYSSINYKDALASRGLNGIIRSWPRIGGIDLTGVVAESSDVRFARGDKVVVHGLGIDVAGYTAAYSLHLMELNGLTPQRGPVLVTGATGGAASLAIDMLARRGYQVTAMSGKADAQDYLRLLGASETVGRPAPQVQPRPLEKGRWAGVLDSVGGQMLAWITRTMLPEGVIAAFGNAGGTALDATVLPFILRGVRLLGINSNSPMPVRDVVWRRIATDLHPRHLNEIAHVIGLEDLPYWLDLTLEGRVRGRTVVDMRR
ncbi:alcohol dehydrogenase catalytic domain-containing protein [Bordetella sp. FB-8]|uniref:alcohol dehydrogenase catalytic domain-containing protein n=1 Tax=Bordetella sp. FB-8 TaxID=1159870 RepID=UPI0003808063|nr:alcohol dehydrogenase catalytic domain-containing protein [Bordetella sp. FB-8]